MKVHRLKTRGLSGNGGKRGHRRKGKGSGCGRAYHPHPGKEVDYRHHTIWQDNTAADLFSREENRTASQDMPINAAPITQDSGNCTLCKNQCPLSDPGCPKGEALAHRRDNIVTGG